MDAPEPMDNILWNRRVFIPDDRAMSEVNGHHHPSTPKWRIILSLIKLNLLNRFYCYLMPLSKQHLRRFRAFEDASEFVNYRARLKEFEGIFFSAFGCRVDSDPALLANSHSHELLRKIQKKSHPQPQRAS